MVNAIAPKVRGFLDEIEHQRPPPAELVQAEAKQHREQQHLENFSLGERIDDRVGNDIHQEIRIALHLSGLGERGNRLGVEGRGIDVHAGSWLHDIHDREPDNEGNGADDLEIKQRIAPGLAHLLHVLHPGDTHDHGAEDDRRDDHFDQPDEAVAEGLHRRASLGVEMSDQHADHDGNDDLKI